MDFNHLKDGIIETGKKFVTVGSTFFVAPFIEKFAELVSGKTFEFNLYGTALKIAFLYASYKIFVNVVVPSVSEFLKEGKIPGAKTETKTGFELF